MLNLTAKSSISKMATSCGSCGSRLAGCGGGGEASGLTDETLTPGLAAAAEPARQLAAGGRVTVPAAGCGPGRGCPDVWPAPALSIYTALCSTYPPLGLDLACLLEFSYWSH